MYLPLGKSPEKLEFGRTRARRPAFGRVLFAFLGFALAVGMFALPHGAAAATQTLDEIANLRASNITGNGTATSVHLQVNANDIAGSTLNVTESDYNSRNGVYRSLTTNTATAFNAFLYRAQEPNNNRTSMFTVNWVGRSSTTANPVVLQVYKFAGSATGWRTIASVVPPASSTVFSVSGTVFTASSTNYQMDNFYGSDPSGDISGASVIAVRIFQQNALSTISSTINLQTDMVTSTFGFIGLTQSSYIFLNDNGDNPSLNSARGGVAPDTAITSVKRGERLNLRVQLTATTTAGLAQIPLVRKNFRLQYTALPGGASDCSMVADTNWQFIGDGAQPTSITSISPTSINVSRSFSGYQGERLTSLKATALPGGVTQRSGLFIESTDQTSATSVLATSVDYFALGPDQGTELSYAIHTGDAQPGSTFCFRLVTEDLGQALNLTNYGSPTTVNFTTYKVYPKLTVVSGAADTLRYSKGLGQNKTDTFTDLSNKVTWAAGLGHVSFLAYDSFDHLIFFGSTSANNQFGKYDPASDTFTDLSSKTTWPSATVSYLIYDSFNHLIFFGSTSANNQFGKYDPASDTFTDLSNKVTWAAGLGHVSFLAYDSFDHLIFVGTDSNASGLFGKYDPASDTFTNLTSVIANFNGRTGYLVYDSFNHLIFFGRAASGAAQLGKYDPASNSFTNLTSLVSFFGGRVEYLTYDSFNHLIFFGSSTGNNLFGQYDPATNTFTNLSAKVSAYGDDLVSLTYDSFNHLIFFGGVANNRFGKYNPNPAAKSFDATNRISASVNDATLFLDDRGYYNLGAADNVYESVTSVATTGFTTSFPMFIFKARDTNPNPNADAVTITASGMTSLVNTQTASTVLEVFNLSTSSWEILSADMSAGAFSPTTWSATIAAGSASYFDSASTVYVRVLRNQPNGSAVGLHLDYFNVQFGAGAAPGTSLMTQRAFILQNDNGNTPDTNTQRGSGDAYPVEQGERFIVRFQLDNTGTGFKTTLFNVQFDHNDGIWNSVSSGEISAQLGLSGSNGDALSATTSQCVAGTSFVNGTWHEGTATTNSFTLNANQCTEFGFIFSTATAVPGSVYRFRLVDGSNGNTPLASVATPTITLVTLQEKKYSKTGAGAEVGAAPAGSGDLTYFLDAAGYQAVASDDSIYDTATSSGGNVPVSIFKIRNPDATNTDPISIRWNGQSNVAPSSNNIFLDIWNNTLGAWVTASTNNFTAANTDFTFTSVTSGSALYDSNFFVFVRTRQAAGAEALRTDQVSMSFGAITGPGYQVSSRSDTLSNPQPSVGSNNTVSFVINTSINASQRLEITWPPAFIFPAGLDCGDADVATGTQFALSTTSSACAATATTWGVLFLSGSRTFRLTAPSTAGIYVATGTQITITLGTNANFQQTGNTQITNPSTVGIYTISVGGNFGGGGNMLVSINVGVDVQATVAESLALTVSSVAAVNCTADDGATVTARDTSPTSVPFGTISPNIFYIGCQDLVVSTNGPGYSLTTQENSAMMTAGGLAIPDTTCDAGTCSESAAAAWTNATKNGLGHTCFNRSNHDCDAAYSSGTNFRQVANMSAGETAQAVMSSSTNASATGRIKFRLSAGSAQAAGTYTTLLTYIITATY
jgi:hypothetical protein